MDDAKELMSRSSLHSFELDGQTWPTVEHYYQAMKFDNESYRAKILNANSPEQARKLGQARFKRKRPDLKKVKNTLMTRAIYTKAKTYPIVATRLLETLEQDLVENSQFDYYWGCGRDHRGDNHYGKVLMNVRNKLHQEITSAENE